MWWRCWRILLENPTEDDHDHKRGRIPSKAINNSNLYACPPKRDHCWPMWSSKKTQRLHFRSFYFHWSLEAETFGYPILSESSKPILSKIYSLTEVCQIDKMEPSMDTDIERKIRSENSHQWGDCVLWCPCGGIDQKCNANSLSSIACHRSIEAALTCGFLRRKSVPRKTTMNGRQS